MTGLQSFPGEVTFPEWTIGRYPERDTECNCLLAGLCDDLVLVAISAHISLKMSDLAPGMVSRRYWVAASRHSKRS